MTETTSYTGAHCEKTRHHGVRHSDKDLTDVRSKLTIQWRGSRSLTIDSLSPHSDIQINVLTSLPIKCRATATLKLPFTVSQLFRFSKVSDFCTASQKNAKASEGTDALPGTTHAATSSAEFRTP